MNGNAAHQIFKAPFVDEGLHEPRILQRLEQVQGNAASQIDSTSGEDFEGEIPGLSGKDRDQHFDRHPAQLARVVRVEGTFDNRFCMVFGGGNCLSGFWPLGDFF